MNLRYLYYKILRLCHLISELEFKKQTAFYTSAYKVVNRSKFFDEKWYLSEYPQVKEKCLPAITHYINYGFKEGKLPSKNFDAGKIFELPYPSYYYGLHNTRAKKNAFIEHKTENRIENFMLAKRKILLFTHSLSLTGAPRALFNLAKVLQKEGLEPIVLSPEFGDLEKELKASGIEYYIEPLLLMKLLFQDKVINQFFQFFDTIFFNTLPSLRFAPYIQSKNKKIAWIHEAKLAFEREESSGDVKKLFENIDEVYSVGAYSKSFTDKYITKEKSKILLYGIDKIEAPYIEQVENSLITFGIIGQCSERKGHDIFVEAIKKLPQEVKNQCIFKIIGKFDERKFSKKIKKLAQEEQIHCLGELSYKDTIKEMQKLDCIVCPSIDDPMPMVCTEAFMLEKTVATSKNTGTAQFIQNGNNGYVFEAKVEPLTKQIEEIVKNRASLPAIGKEGIKIYQDQFSPEIFEKEIKNIFFEE